jgi:hypothetical protein
MKAELTNIVYYAPTLSGKKLEKMHLEVIGQENGDIRLRSVDNYSLVFVTKETDFEQVKTKSDYYMSELLKAKNKHIATINEYTKTLNDYSGEMAEHALLKEENIELLKKYDKMLEENIELLKKIKGYETINYN